DRVDQREIGDGPGEQRALGIARATEEERRGGEVVDRADAELALDRLQAVDPDPSLSRTAFGLLALLPAQFDLFGIGVDPTPVAMVGLVVEHHDAAFGTQFVANAADHLVGGLYERAPGGG